MSDQQQQSNGLGTAAMVCGICGLVLSVIPIIGLAAWALAPLAIIFGIIGMSKRPAPRGQAIAGLVTGSVAMVICLLWLVLMFAAGAEAAREERERQGRSAVSMPVSDEAGDTI